MNSVTLPYISSESVAACNALYAGVTSYAFSLGGRSWKLSFSGTGSAPLWRVKAHVSVGDFPATLFADGNLLADWPESGLNAAALASLPALLLRSLLEVWLEDLIVVLEPHLGKALLVESIELLRPLQAPESTARDMSGELALYPEGGIPFQLVRDDGQILLGLLLAAPQLVLLLAHILAKLGDGSNDTATAKDSAAWKKLAWLTLPIPVFFGKICLNIGLLRSVGIGDIVFPDIPERGPSGAIRASLMLSPHLGAVGTWHNGTLCVEEIFMPFSDVISKDPAAVPVAQENTLMPETVHSPEGIPVQVEFILGIVQSSVGALAALKVGHIFTTNSPVEQPVCIRVNGATVGQGALVDVQGVLGVRVLSLAWEGTEALSATDLPS